MTPSPLPKITSSLHHGDALNILRDLPAASVEGVITDPPYASGGRHIGDKMRDVADKYQQRGVIRQYPSFSGDALDQRAYSRWCLMWLEECLRIMRDGAYFITFIDWRQLPLMTDIVQASGLSWRGVAVWDKGPGSRAPHKGYLRHQCEYLVDTVIAGQPP
jgi:site-specific DNA-methyltransferase (adenine-specific)